MDTLDRFLIGLPIVVTFILVLYVALNINNTSNKCRCHETVSVVLEVKQDGVEDTAKIIVPINNGWLGEHTLRFPDPIKEVKIRRDVE
jgi:hypothetical protein